MTVTMTRIARSGPAIQAALRESSPEEAALFAAEYRSAINRAASTLDLSESEAVLIKWWGIATIRANPLTPEEQAIVSAVRAGDDLPAGTPVVEDPRS